MIQIFHNARCSKSRECLLHLRQSNKQFEVINYLETKPSYAEIVALLKKLAIPPIDLIRKKEPVWVTNYKGKALTDSEVIQAMADHPILIERPIVVNGDKAVIARPLEKAASII
ncbi:MAG TPA: arsenate reductase (glutaredoxin) [Flavobacterium sp.]|jgi:arsenate reductase